MQVDGGVDDPFEMLAASQPELAGVGSGTALAARCTGATGRPGRLVRAPRGEQLLLGHGDLLEVAQPLGQQLDLGLPGQRWFTGSRVRATPGVDGVLG